MPPLSSATFRPAIRNLLSTCALSLSLGTLAHAELEINQATEAQLDSLLHVGPALSQKILSQRQQSPFADWPDLIRRVPGIGPRRARQLSHQGLTVQGQAYPGTPQPESDKP
ncbi:ComEA family DNA-binding protein [Curvibacter gracilis]|uniref:ComEA family DNA-binding protein n=1 Tax=Curvibacter gracilis TaxID=230310 RepID=UPI0004B74D9C|nr:helix-hairpin-helix domain-containing protein [Curvibacter gracilis]